MVNDPDMIARVVAGVRRMQAMTPEERQIELARMAKRQRKRNCEFCKKHPEKCLP